MIASRRRRSSSSPRARTRSIGDALATWACGPSSPSRSHAASYSKRWLRVSSLELLEQPRPGPLAQVGLLVVALVLNDRALEIERAGVCITAAKAFDLCLHRCLLVFAFATDRAHLVDDRRADAIG